MARIFTCRCNCGRFSHSSGYSRVISGISDDNNQSMCQSNRLLLSRALRITHSYFVLVVVVVSFWIGLLVIVDDDVVVPTLVDAATGTKEYQRRMTQTSSSSSLLKHYQLGEHGRRRRSDASRPLDFLLQVSISSISNHDDFSPSGSDELRQQQSMNSFWPPWPFNMLRRRDTNEIVDGSDRSRNNSPPNTVLFNLFRFTKTSTKVGIRTAQEFGSQLWFHSPPAIPPLILYALWPYRTRVQISTTNAADVIVSENVLYKTILPLWSNGWVRNGVLFTSALAIVSWAHAEIHRHRKLTPLPLLYPDLLRAELPPFLPEQVSTYIGPTNSGTLFNSNVIQEDGEAGSSALTTPLPVDTTSFNSENEMNTGEGILANLSPRRWRRHFMQFRNDITPRPSTLRNRIRDWQRMREIYHAEQKNAHRLAIYEELLLWQQATRTKGRSSTSTKKSKNVFSRRQIFKKWNPFRKSKNRFDGSMLTNENDGQNSNSTSLGYALVTGASQGIGRAIAVELARWQIPLILVARDIQALTELAYDIQTCYGIDCTVLSADLSRPHASELIYKTVTDAGLQVDIIVNNAGVSSHGETLNMPLTDVQRMIQVNTMAVTSLTHLFGRDMKERRRGRILLVSSVCGAVSGIATVAVYAATKAYENSFGAALGKELEPYGIGVTSLMPGAVRGTEFRSRSKSQDALCWKLPFYSKSAPSVAESGIRALLRGDTEVTPGILNRLFLKVMKPVLPQRIHNLMAEIMWNPIQLPFQARTNKNGPVEAPEIHEQPTLESNLSTVGAHTELRQPIIIRPQQFWSTLPSPRILYIEEPVQEQNETAQVISEESSLSLEDIDKNVTTRTIDRDDTGEKHDVTPEFKENEELRGRIRMSPTNDSQQRLVEEEWKEKPHSVPRPLPPSLSELDLLLEQYKRHRSISIDDPWNRNDCTGGYVDSHMLPSLKGNDRFAELQDLDKSITGTGVSPVV